MAGIPEKCPACGNRAQWKEQINIFTSGIPIGGKARFHLFSIRGLFAYPIKKALGFYTVTYRCRECGFREKYPLDDPMH